VTSRIGFVADRTTLANWMIACGQLIRKHPAKDTLFLAT
jgi:hypothetical protein